MIDDPILVQGSTAWLDRFFGMGEFMKDLILQYDYPTESVYLPARTFSILGNVQRWRVIRIFERRKPLLTHCYYEQAVNKKFSVRD